MNYYIAALGLLTAFVQGPPMLTPTCSVQQFDVGTKTKPFYVCDASSNGLATRVTVPKVWFKQHCHAYDRLANGDAATCDAIYEGARHPTSLNEAAHPSGSRARLKAFAYGAAGLGVLAVCAMTGGCGFMGGGL